MTLYTPKTDLQNLLFLDRDGTLIKEKNYLSDPNQVELENGVIEGLSLLKNNGWQFIIITNQSGIGRGYFSQEQFWTVQEKLYALLKKSEISILDCFFCPHTPEDNCSCRKPKPQMVLDALNKYPVPLSRCVFIGDKEADILCANNAGITGIHVQTGHGKTLNIPQATYAAPHFLDAALWILR